MARELGFVFFILTDSAFLTKGESQASHCPLLMSNDEGWLFTHGLQWKLYE